MTSPSYLGHGVGLRRQHYPRVLSGPVDCDWFEVISENFIGVGGRARRILFEVRERYPVVLHGVSLSIGSTDPLDLAYLDGLRQLASDLEAAWVSDHLCFTRAGGVNSHDLLPLPYNEETLRHVIGRVLRVQERLGRTIALENASSYVRYRISGLYEWEFLAELSRATGCGILLDINNIDVSCHNHGWDRRSYLDGIPAGSVWQFHLAGPSEYGSLLIDTHDHPVPGRVWDLYKQAVARFGEVSSLVEWDSEIPEWEELAGERAKAAAIMQEVLAAKRAASCTAGPSTGLASRITPSDSPGLAEAEQLFLDLVRAPMGVEAGMAELEERGIAARTLVSGLFEGDGRASAVSRLDIYANMFFYRLRDILAEDFEKTHSVVGPERFHNLVTGFLLVHPPTEPSLRWLGKPFPGFAARSEEAREFPFLADLALLEWTRLDAFQAEDAESLDAGLLAQVDGDDWPRVRFVKAPHVHLLDVRYCVEKFWEEDPAEEGVCPEGPHTLLAYRQDEEVLVECVSAGPANRLRRLLAGARFEEVCELVPGDSIEDSAHLAAVELAVWIQKGLFRDFSKD